VNKPVIPEYLQYAYDETQSLAVRSLIERIGRVEHERDVANAQRIVLSDQLIAAMSRIRELEFKYIQPKEKTDGNY
jgi:hypothetical protein